MKMLVLFLAPLLSGLLIFLVPQPRTGNFKLLLVFAGSYLFAITVIHILPVLYRQHADVEGIGLFVLLGFFLQQLIEHFTAGIEHGHIHAHDKGHGHSGASALVLLAALCVHAFMEGGILVRPHPHTLYSSTNAILLGIVLHRAPAAFALMAVLAGQKHPKGKSIAYLAMFSLAAPLGYFIGEYFVAADWLSGTGLVFLYALVSGGFLYISTTIVFESSPGHHFNAKRLLVALAGSLMAVAVEYLF